MATGLAEVIGAERRVATRRAEPRRAEQFATISAAPMTHCLRINRGGTANLSTRERNDGAAASRPFFPAIPG